ncbi:hypothetical protein F5B20DRAFT_546475 [Whalleya microplaca]|nr:hypothetical protein F5B20DRAFT_546475 [Whalleya microplaca]
MRVTQSFTAINLRLRTKTDNMTVDYTSKCPGLASGDSDQTAPGNRKTSTEKMPPSKHSNDGIVASNTDDENTKIVDPHRGTLGALPREMILTIMENFDAEDFLNMAHLSKFYYGLTQQFQKSVLYHIVLNEIGLENINLAIARYFAAEANLRYRVVDAVVSGPRDADKTVIEVERFMDTWTIQVDQLRFETYDFEAAEYKELLQYHRQLKAVVQSGESFLTRRDDFTLGTPSANLRSTRISQAVYAADIIRLLEDEAFRKTGPPWMRVTLGGEGGGLVILSEVPLNEPPFLVASWDLDAGYISTDEESLYGELEP